MTVTILKSTEYQIQLLKIAERGGGDGSVLHRNAAKVLHHAQQLLGAAEAIQNDFGEEEARDRVVEE